MSLLDRLPGGFKLIAFTGILLAAPSTVLAFLFLGPYTGLGTILFWVFFFVILYMIAVRKYG